MLRITVSRLVALAVTLCVAPATAQTPDELTPQEWIDRFRTGTNVQRRSAARSVASLGAEALPALMRALEDPDTSVRGFAADALGYMGPAAKRAGLALAQLRGDPDVLAQLRANIASLRVRASVEYIPELVRALDSEDWETCVAAAEALHGLGAAARPAAKALVAALESNMPFFDHTMLDEHRHLPTLVHNVRRAAALALGEIGVTPECDPVPALVTASSHEVGAVRLGALAALAQIRGRAGQPHDTTLAAITDPSDLRRQESIGGLVAQAETDDATCESLVSAAIHAIDAPQLPVRLDAIHILCALGPRAAHATDALLAKIGSADKRVLVEAAVALRLIATPKGEVADRLLAMLKALPPEKKSNDVERMRRLAIIEAFSDLVPEARDTPVDAEIIVAALEYEALSPAERLASDARESRAELEAALRALDDPASSAPAARAPSAAGSPSPFIDIDEAEYRQMKALFTLASARDRDATPLIVQFLDQRHAPVVRACAASALMQMDAVESAPELQKQLDDAELRVRLTAALALCMFQHAPSRSRVMEVFRELLDDGSPMALTYVGYSDLVEFVPDLEQMLLDPKASMQNRMTAGMALVRMRQCSAPKFIKLADIEGTDPSRSAQTNEMLRSVAAHGLALAPDAAHREVLIALAQLDDPYGRHAALAALAHLGHLDALESLAGDEAFTRLFGATLTTDQHTKLRDADFRCSELTGLPVRDVLARITAATAIPIDISDTVAPTLDAENFGASLGFIGVRPDALTVLDSFSEGWWPGHTPWESRRTEPRQRVLAIATAERIRLVDESEARAHYAQLIEDRKAANRER